MTTRTACKSIVTAMAIAGQASRACDVCMNKSARWYCGADRAYLCEKCDIQVHSANALAQRHERVPLTPNAESTILARKDSPDTKNAKEILLRKPTMSKKLQAPPVNVLPSRKRFRTCRLHPFRQAKHSPGAKHAPNQLEEGDAKMKEDLLMFSETFETENFLVDVTQKVPSLIVVMQDSSPSSSELDVCSDFFQELRSDSQEVRSSPWSDSLAAFFKGKAAQEDCFPDDDTSDQFFLPDAFDDGINICCDMDGNISVAGDACFISNDIPGLSGFEDFGSREFVGDSLSFDFAFHDTLPRAFEGVGADTSEMGGISSKYNLVGAENDQFRTGPFVKFFSKIPRNEKKMHLTPENIKKEAKEILLCCREGLSEVNLGLAPTLRLNYEDVITAWSDRGEPWFYPHDCTSDATDAGLVPDMAQEGADDCQGSREASVMRFKEKRRSRLFSKRIRYEVRKLNAEKRPRMKGRFVKKNSSGFDFRLDPFLSSETHVLAHPH